MKVVEKAAGMSGSGKALPSGKALGFAFTLSFGTWVAQVAQVTLEGDAIRVEKVWCAVDVGTALDPRIIESQMKSGIIFGLSAAMGQEITFADGKVQQSNFTDFDAMRMNQAPEIEVAVRKIRPGWAALASRARHLRCPRSATPVFAAPAIASGSCPSRSRSGLWHKLHGAPLACSVTRLSHPKTNARGRSPRFSCRQECRAGDKPEQHELPAPPRLAACLTLNCFIPVMMPF